MRADSNANHLDLGPLHTDVKAHCQAIIDKPDLLLGDQTKQEFFMVHYGRDLRLSMQFMQ